MRSQLERAINLASRTGDKIIVVDELNDRSSVVMNLDDYERLLKSQNKGRNDIDNLTEEELLDKINHDIVSWKDANSDRTFSSEISGFHDNWDDDDDDNFDDKDLEEEGIDDEDEDLDVDDSSFAKATEDEEINTDIFPDFTKPYFNADENLSSQPEENLEEAELTPEKNITEEPVIAETKIDEDENVYYYHEPEPEVEAEPELKTEPKPELEPESEIEPVSEPESTKIVENKPEKQEETLKDENGFTSIKDELKKNKKAWAIPEDVKKSAEDVKM
jgi:hypothetical protein